ncbi:unnamed protein product [Clavelina lepadiformis]|uniref:Non-lysosomal glucosylceramidase n=1 Tax=Clavelina lepadiformis TaxID=159417 RepID=A0ABP0GSL1_CLALP
MAVKQPEWCSALKDISLSNPDDNDDNNLMRTWRGKHSGVGVPAFGWKISLSHKFKDRPNSWSLPPLSQVPSLVGLGVRYLLYYKKLRSKSKRPCMDFFNQTPLHQIYGVPLGGIGGGTINRGWKGDFCKWQLKPGVYTFDSPLADQFIVTIRSNDRTVFQQVLSTRFPSGEPLKAWNWRYCGSYAYYHGLYPRAWTVYDLQGQDVVLTCRQISPVFPHDYQDTSIPAAVFVWTVENKRKDDIDVTITMSMENGIGCQREQKVTTSLWNEFFSVNNHGENVSGVVMHNTTYDNMFYTMTIGATQKEGTKVSHCVEFNPLHSGTEIWHPLMERGQLSSLSKRSHVTGKGERIASAVAVSCHVKAKSTNSIDFCLAWDMPQIHFGNSNKFYKRRYTRWFGDQGKAGPALAAYSLYHYPTWEEKIHDWQSPILENSDLPGWYKSAIFNELYYITDGGTVWLEGESSDVTMLSRNAYNGVPESKHNLNGNSMHLNNGIDKTKEDEIRNCKHIMEYGRFAYLEGQEYKMYNTYDVHFYASIALAHLWPNLEISLQYDIAASILHSNPEPMQYLMDGVAAPVKTPNCVPHDVGCPDDEPWLNVNAYFVHDTAEWRDLNPKFVLQAFRDYHITKNKEFLETVWPICKIVMNHGMRHDQDGDGLIENSGAADQTFDGWCVQGPSAYCGGLWLAALKFMAEAASILGHDHEESEYNRILQMATKSYNKHLWNGKYYNYDSSPHLHLSNSVMADQCAGQWFLSAAEIDDVLPKENVRSALETIFSLNVQKYDNGRHGAVNGMRPNGVVDTSSVQSVEVWTGVTYALAATMIHRGLLKEGFRTASGIYRSAWQRYGMSYQTPEAFRMNKTYRSLAYMRPLSIWGMQYALEMPKKDKEN